MIIEHHTSIHAIIHEANNRSKLEQYANHRKISKRVWDMILRIATNTAARGTLIGAIIEKDTATEKFALYVEKKTIGFICFNYINSYI